MRWPSDLFDLRFDPRPWRGWMALWLCVAAMAGVGIGHLYTAHRGASTPGPTSGEATTAPAEPAAGGQSARSEGAPFATTPAGPWAGP